MVEIEAHPFLERTVNAVKRIFGKWDITPLRLADELPREE